MDFTQQKQIISDFQKRVTMTPDRVLNLADQIQELGRSRPETALCKFGRSMQVRRLRSVRPQSWNRSDFSNAQNIVTEIDSLTDKAKTDEGALALAVLGVETEHLDEALAALGAPMNDVNNASNALADSNLRDLSGNQGESKEHEQEDTSTRDGNARPNKAKRRREAASGATAAS